MNNKRYSKIGGALKQLHDVSAVFFDESSKLQSTRPMTQPWRAKNKESNLIISKGQRNLKSLLDIEEKPTTIYILKVKCKTMAEFLHRQIGKAEIIIQEDSLK